MWRHICDTNTETASVTVTNTVVAVDSLAPTNIPAGMGGLEEDSDPPTYWVCTCAGDIIVTASSCPGLTADQLPGCWTFTGGVEIDKLHHKVSAATLKDGPVTFTVTCGTSSKTIIVKGDNVSGDWVGISQGSIPLCDCDGGANANPLASVQDLCGNNLNINCESHWLCNHYVYRYNTILIVGVCLYTPAINYFAARKTENLCRFTESWHITLGSIPGGYDINGSLILNAIWTVTVADLRSPLVYSETRTAPTWNDDWNSPINHPNALDAGTLVP